MKKFLLVLAVSLTFIGKVEAAELYDVIHQEVINAGGVLNYFETRQYVVNMANNYQKLLEMMNEAGTIRKRSSVGEVDF